MEDRPGGWSTLYQTVLDQVQALGALSVEEVPRVNEAYAFVNNRILEEAARMARTSGEEQAAVVVWEGMSRGPGDLTMRFAANAKERGVRVLEVNTLE